MTDKNFIFFKNLDSHFYIELFNKIKICIKNNNKFKYKKATIFGVTKEKRTRQIIISLTSYPERINTVYLTINTLLRQTVKPDRIILWLAEKQFINKEKDLPENLLKLQELGLEIKWCEDLKSYKKLIPALKAFPEDIIVTADDDLYYQKDWLESLYDAYLKNPKNIYTRRASYIYFKNNKLNIIEHYKNKENTPSYNMQFFGGSGTLYPPHSLHKDVFDIEQIKILLPTNDDIYFWGMAILNRTKISVINGYDINLYTIEGTQKNGLCKINKNNNDYGLKPKDAIMRLLERYPELYQLLDNGVTKCSTI